MKFGGTSVGNAQSIKCSAQIVAKRIKQKPVVVVSAVAGVTDMLVSLALERSNSARLKTYERVCKTHLDILGHLGIDQHVLKSLLDEFSGAVKSLKGSRAANPRDHDYIVSFGERFSSRIFAAVLNKFKVQAQAYDSWDIGMLTTPVHGNSEPLAETPTLIRKALSKVQHVPVVTGFIGKAKNKQITTLGRGGSDYTTAIIGGALKAKEIQIWKEVDGVLSADPRIVAGAKLVSKLQYEEAGELAYFGAKVLHPKTMLPAMRQNVPIRVMNTFKPDGAGTLILASADTKNTSDAKAITCKKNTLVVTINSPEFFDGSGLMSRIFSMFEKYSVPVDVVSTSVVSVSCTFSTSCRYTELMKELSKLGSVDVVHSCAVVCVVGAHMKSARVIRKACNAFENADIPVRMISESASGISVTFLVKEDDAHRSVIALHKALIS